MRKEPEHAVRRAFVSWAARQSPPPGLVLPEVSTAGKKIDLVCVEGPPRSNRLPSRLKPYRLDVWLRPDTPFSRPDWVRRFGIDQTHMKEIEGYLSGNRVWIVELKEHLTAEALGQALVYEHHFSREYPGMPVRRTLVAGLIRWLRKCAGTRVSRRWFLRILLRTGYECPTLWFHSLELE